MFDIEQNTWADTEHKFIFGRSVLEADKLPEESVHLIVTSPPYPMIEMWDDVFKTKVEKETAASYDACWENQINEIWYVLKVCYSVLAEGGWIAVNIGNALRKAPEFRMFDNISAMATGLYEAGFDLFPSIIWKKQANKPNSFMGPGMIPGGYVTLEHEAILLGRKGGNRKYSEEEKERRKKSAFFWSERNTWFSSSWNVPGTKQGKEDRTGAFPVDIPFRLINMLSIVGDTVLDPYAGTGTTNLAAASSGRNSIGIELNENRKADIKRKMSSVPEVGKKIQSQRIANQQSTRFQSDSFMRKNNHHGLMVKTEQEEQIRLCSPKSVEEISEFEFKVKY